MYGGCRLIASTLPCGVTIKCHGIRVSLAVQGRDAYLLRERLRIIAPDLTVQQAEEAANRLIRRFDSKAVDNEDQIAKLLVECGSRIPEGDLCAAAKLHISLY
jgi:hypothetical protein